jgi:hypothetical protein
VINATMLSLFLFNIDNRNTLILILVCQFDGVFNKVKILI